MEKQQIKKKSSILIEVVDNGFIVKEDYQVNFRESPERSHKSKVFQTKKSLNNYINENL